MPFPDLGLKSSLEVADLNLTLSEELKSMP
jgi:hypothetical protein